MKKQDEVLPVKLPPTMTGTWDYTLFGKAGSVTDLMNLTEEGNGALRGTLGYANEELDVCGIIQNYQIALAHLNPAFSYQITRMVNREKNSFFGKIEVGATTAALPTYLGFVTMKATKFERLG